MTLDENERLLLRNQYLILSRMVPEENDYERMMKIVESGYEAHYPELTFGFSTPFSAEDSSYVLNVLTMFAAFDWSKKNGTEVLATHSDLFEFRGFDGNDEIRFMFYAEFLIGQENRWVEFKGKDLNSHMPTRDRYQRMLTGWELSSNKYELTREDFLRIGSTVRA